MHPFLLSQKYSKKAALVLIIIMVLTALGSASMAEPNKGYTNVYEPLTSLQLSATVCWQANGEVMNAALGSVRPSSALVFIDAALRVLDEDGGVIAPLLSQYLEETSSAFIPVFYVRDDKTSAALYDYLKDKGKKDVFIAVSYPEIGLLKDLRGLPHIRGMVDFREMAVSSAEDLLDIVRVTNGGGAKIALLSQKASTGEAVRYLQTRLITVWSQTDSDRVSLLTALTRGVNGILVNDYRAAYGAIEFFQDDAPTLLRVPLIAGHRGMASEYVENTLMSAQGAFAAGADVIENDIYLSRDGELFINHDASLKRLFDRGDIRDTEKLTLAELQAIPFSFSGMNGVNYSNHTPAAKSRYGSILQNPSARIPSLREYYETFTDTDIVHFVEIKSHNRQIVQALKALNEEMGTFGQTVVISFNTEILEEMRRVWPEMSLGALGTEGANFLGGQPGFMDYTAIMKGEGRDKALELLYRVLQPYNATYNPKFTYTYDVASAGRHRGLTLWPWTYSSPELFARDYLRGVYGLTTNFAWWGSGLVTKIQTQELVLGLGESVPQPQFVNQMGETTQGNNAQLIPVSGTAVRDGKAMEIGESVLIWRSLQSLIIDGNNYGDYYMYSEPFRVSVKSI